MEVKHQWRVLEFYSGIGGMRYSLIKAGVNAEVAEAFDINDVANDVYEHNFGHRPYQKKKCGFSAISRSARRIGVDEDLSSLVLSEFFTDRQQLISSALSKLTKGNIQSLTAADLDRYEAQAWLLSPPCQPYTRQGLQKQSGDARAFSFLRILELIPQLSRPPILLFVENVVGFETSDTHAKMIETLKSSGFVTQEFILSPLQFGVPYSRPRYFCSAKRNPSSFLSPCFNDKLIWCPSPLFVHNGELVTDECLRPQDNWDKLLESCVPVEHFLEFKSTAGPKTAEHGFENANIVSRELNDPLKGHDERNGFNSTDLDLYHVPLNLIERWGSAMDIVYPDSRRCCCFTKSYYRYVKGTGSLLATVQPEMKGKEFPLKEQCLRYFTPREVANFHSFPEHFVFPDHVNLKQRYALLGNSLSVAVVAPLLHYLFTEPS